MLHHSQATDNMLQMVKGHIDSAYPVSFPEMRDWIVEQVPGIDGQWSACTLLDVFMQRVDRNVYGIEFFPQSGPVFVRF